jgi:hypothetical protein
MNDIIRDIMTGAILKHQDSGETSINREARLINEALIDNGYEIVKKNDVMFVKGLEQTGHGCPTVFEWKDKKDDDIYFRLRNGHARITNETKDQNKISNDFPYGDGVCNWDEVVKWAADNNLELKS